MSGAVPPPEPRRGKYVRKAVCEKRPLAMGPACQLAVNAYAVWGFSGWTYIWRAALQGPAASEREARRGFLRPAVPPGARASPA
ncbi:hypothetical protein [Streptomyces sp. G45]|uniref:hypothetical protein n=1 Tax=Streptomyces sp. G45 TaxID=3406627 RepID=UPI003C22D3F5